MRFTPASRHMSSWCRAPVTSVAPTTRNPPRPPNVIVPSVRAETRRPLRPSCRYSIANRPSSCRRPRQASAGRADVLPDRSQPKPIRGGTGTSGQLAQGVHELAGELAWRHAAAGQDADRLGADRNGDVQAAQPAPVEVEPDRVLRG